MIKKAFICENHIHIEIDDIIITTRIIKDPYPDYDGVIPKENTNTVIINKECFSELWNV